MIEVEKKFILRNGDHAKLIKGSTFLNRRAFTDSYYDTEGFELALTDTWLRSRNDKYELKVPMTTESQSKRLADQYDQLNDEELIANYLQITLHANGLAQSLNNAGYLPFVTMTTVREKFQSEKFIIDIDSIDFGYHIAEIELQVEDKSQIPTAIDEILAFGTKLGLTVAPVRGKVTEFLYRNRPDVFERLVAAKII